MYICFKFLIVFIKECLARVYTIFHFMMLTINMVSYAIQYMYFVWISIFCIILGLTCVQNHLFKVCHDFRRKISTSVKF